MFDNSSVSTIFDEKSLPDPFIHVNFSSTVRSIRYFVHFVILFVFIILLTFINRRQKTIGSVTRPCSNLSRFLVSISIVGLVLVDILVINGVSHPFCCSIYHFSLEILLTIIVTSRLLPDFYDYSSKITVVLSLFVIVLIQLCISIESLLKTSIRLSIDLMNPPILCPTSIRPQLLIFLLHCLELILNLQSTNSTTIFQLNSICLRLIYFTGTSVLHVFFWPSLFSATFYASILVIESVLIDHENVRSDENLCFNNERHRSFLRLKSDELTDETRLLNSID
jgi:hypothetical protein